MNERQVKVRPGRHFGWWVDGHFASGRRFMLTWWPAENMARTVARWFSPHAESGPEATSP
jgi:hypothetical protein